MNYEVFKKWLGQASAVEVDGMYVIYPPQEDDGRIEFRESDNQEEPYFAVGENDEYRLLENGSVTVKVAGLEEEWNIIRLIRDGGDDESSKYAFNGGSSCPKCGSENLSSTDSLDHCGDRAYQNCHCEDCNVEFTDEYRLVGMKIIEDEEVRG